MIKYPLAFIRLLLCITASLYCAFFGLIRIRFSRKKEIYLKYLSMWGSSCLWFLGYKIDVKGKALPTGTIVMPNHRSYIDIFVVMKYSPSSIVAKKEVGSWPILRWTVKPFRMILVDRKSSKSMIQTMRSIKDNYERGGKVILFPEGTTHVGPDTKKFKPGSFTIAAKTNIPITPIAISYKDPKDAWVGDDYFIPHWFRQLGKFKKQISVRIGEPIVNDNHEVLMEQTKSWLDANLLDMEKQWN